MALQHPSPAVKFEASVDSFSSTQDLSLYSPASPAATVNPLEVLTPKDDGRDSPASCVHDESPGPTDAADKKPTKKRKSWGQVLPEPKTNLPPRKRAKTEDEKEQRRVERVLRNRRAAQSSRERKRLEVEALEKRNKELEAALLDAQKANVVLVQELHRVRRDSGVVTRSSSPLDSLRDNPVTLSQQLFGSQDGPKSTAEQSSDLVGELIMSTTNPTVNPASLSPELTPVPDLVTTALSTPEPQACLRTAAASSDLTQRPAEMLCDLQCHTSEEAPLSLASPTHRSALWAWTLHLRMLLLSASALLSACHRPLMQIAMSSRAGFSLHPTPQLLTTIIWLVTLPPARQLLIPSTSTTSSTKTPTLSSPTLWQRATTSPRTTDSSSKLQTLRFKSLRKILSSSPTLARPLMDATMEALRLVSEGYDDRTESLRAGPRATRGTVAGLSQSLREVELPSREVLLTLLWALRLEERRITRRSEVKTRFDRSIPEEEPTGRYILNVLGTRREGRGGGVEKRRRLA